MTTTADAATPPADPAVTPPGPSDTTARTRKPDQAPVTDPEAPYGWMNDPVTGERRPKKRPGRQGTTQKALPPPDTRKGAGSKTREKKAGANVKSDYSGEITGIAEAMWMLMASVPENTIKVGKIDLGTATTRIHAEAAILKDNAAEVVQGVNIMATNSKPVARVIEKLSASDGESPLWILPAMFALMPFVGQSMAMWRAPVRGDIEELAKKTRSEWDKFVGRNMPAENESEDNSGAGPAE